MMEESFKRKGKKKSKETELEAKIGQLERILGQREFELDWLTKIQGAGILTHRRQLLDI